MRRSAVAAIAMLATYVPLASASAQSSEGTATPDATAPGPAGAAEAVVEQDVPASALFSFEQHGYFRFRADAFGQAHLHPGARRPSLISGMIPPLGKNAAQQNGGEVPSSDRRRDYLAGANIRLRLDPTLRIDENFAFHAQIDILDNLVLGSTPAWSPRDPLRPLPFFADGQVSPSSGVNSLDDAIRVKRAWMSWDIFHLVRAELGRMPFHWGSGMLQNDGNCIDCDHGDTVDRLAVTAGPFNFASGGLENLYATFAWDFPGEGAVLGNTWAYPLTTGGATLGAAPSQAFGQPVDASRLDDVSQYVLTVESRARSLSAIAERRRRLEVERAPVVEWGWINIFRTQEYSIDLPESQSASQLCNSQAPQTSIAVPGLEVPFDCTRLFPRDAFTWTTDFWLRLDWLPSPKERFSFEIELAGVLFGKLGQTSSLRTEDTSKDIWGGGAVLRTHYGREAWTWGIEVGVASGDPDAQWFGVRDGSNLTVPDSQSGTTGGQAIRSDRAFTQFRFNRDYIVDLLLFREVIGAVTNTIYVKPEVSYDFFEFAGYTLGSRLSVLYAASMFPEGTPGSGRHLGVETDAQIYVRAAPYFTALVEGGLLVPLDAFKVAYLPNPDLAWTVQFRTHFTF